MSAMPLAGDEVADELEMLCRDDDDDCTKLSMLLEKLSIFNPAEVAEGNKQLKRICNKKCKVLPIWFNNLYYFRNKYNIYRNEFAK